MQFSSYERTIDELSQNITEPVAIERLSADKTYVSSL